MGCSSRLSPRSLLTCETVQEIFGLRILAISIVHMPTYRVVSDCHQAPIFRCLHDSKRYCRSKVVPVHLTNVHLEEGFESRIPARLEKLHLVIKKLPGSSDLANMAIDSKKVRLDVRYDLQRKELMIDFMSGTRARNYQINNKESRIMPEGNLHNQRVWLPLGSDMRYIRACREGFAIVFTSEEAAKAWSDRVLIGSVSAFNKMEVIIHREWEGAAIDRMLQLDPTLFGFRPVEAPFPSRRASPQPGPAPVSKTSWQRP